ncbi:protein serine/threonine phosphatase 2C family protein [archaeon]|nr:MAG: protein serine/threonine phosphatase 2C family protein [archaeon]
MMHSSLPSLATSAVFARQVRRPRERYRGGFERYLPPTGLPGTVTYCTRNPLHLAPLYPSLFRCCVQLCSQLSEEEDFSGSTALVCVYDSTRHRVTVAVAGDSAAVLSRGGRAVLLTEQHRLSNKAERERVEARGGKVINSRVNGVLAVSRAMGDVQFKAPIPASKNMTDWPESLVSAVPDVKHEVITPMSEFLVLATDGVWDVMQPQDAVDLVRQAIIRYKDIQRAAKELAREALHRGSVDNVSVIILVFGGEVAKG